MTATLHLLLGPAGSGKTAALLRAHRDVLRRDLGGVLWLGPTQRAIDELRSRMARTGGMCGLRLLTFAELAAKVHQADGQASKAMSGAQRRLVVEEVVADLSARGELVHFGAVCDTTGFVEALMGLIRELEGDGVSAAAFARALYRRGYHGPLVGRAFRSSAVSRKDRECARLFARYLRELRRQRLHDPEGREASARRRS